MKRKNLKVKEFYQFLFSVIVAGSFFLISAFLAQEFSSDICGIIGMAGIWGILLYVGLTSCGGCSTCEHSNCNLKVEPSSA